MNIDIEEPLAVFGGKPIRSTPWPKWPLGTPNSQRALIEVLHSGKWAISGYANVKDTWERRASRAFAEYIGTKYCVACSSGSAALSIALQSLGIGDYDEVIMPGLTWVACPSSVSRLGAIPVFADVDASTLCPSIIEIESLITPSTRAILMVHMYSSICDIEGYLNLSNKYNIPIIEDASQAHGASWKKQKVGSFGQIGVFSTQQSKLLSSGEGGLCVTDDFSLYKKIQQLRADGRQYKIFPGEEIEGDYVSDHGYELEAVGDVAGQNYCMSEFQAALIYEGLTRLDSENKQRQKCVEALYSALNEIKGVYPLSDKRSMDERTFYRLALRIDPDHFAGLNAEQLVPAVESELNNDVRRVDAPLNSTPLYNPLESENSKRDKELEVRLNPRQHYLPESDRAQSLIITFPHQVFLSDPSDMFDIVNSFRKVQSHCQYLASRADELLKHEEL